MRKSHIDNMRWPFHINGGGNLNNPWPELCPTNQVKHSPRKMDLMNSRENDRVITLDDFEYPELGDTSVKRRNSIRPKTCCFPGPTVNIVLSMETNTELNRPKGTKRNKWTKRICINLQEALQNTRYINTTNNKELHKVKINLYKRNHTATIASTADEAKSSDFRKVKMCISKDKKPSRLKKIILLNRSMKAKEKMDENLQKILLNINIQKRDAFEHAKMEAICKDVDAINFNALKITADPTTDVDYVRNMSTMTLYNKDYRTKNENISESSVYHRPDIIEQINNLCIQRKQLSNKLTRNNNRNDLPQIDNDVIENDIVKQTLSLELKDDAKEEIQNSTEIEDKNLLKYSRNFREYCTNMATTSLNDSLEKFLGEITRLQRRFHEKNPNKSKYKRRYYSGLKEVRKQIELKKVKFVIIAPDLEKIELEGGLDDQIDKLLDTCKRQNVVFCFGLRRRKLGYYTHGKGFVGCVGIANYSGTEILFKNLLMELVQARNEFKKLSGAKEAAIDISKVLPEDYLLSESVNALLKVLSPLSIYS